MRMVYGALFFSIATVGCDNSQKPTSDGQTSSKVEPTSTCLDPNTIYYYKSAFPSFVERLDWVAETTETEWTTRNDELKKEQDRIEKWAKWVGWSSIGGGPGAKYLTERFSVMIQQSMRAALLQSEDEADLPFWMRYPLAFTPDQFSNYLERLKRALPKLEGDGEWKTAAIEDLQFELADPAKEVFVELGEYNLGSPDRTSQCQSSAKVVAHSGALVFRSSDKSVLFISGVKWNHPLYSEGYTEYHLHISQVTGAVISDSLAFTSFPLEPGEFSQLKEIASVSASAIRLAAGLMPSS
jgi:hypothetical protein